MAHGPVQVCVPLCFPAVLSVPVVCVLGLACREGCHAVVSVLLVRRIAAAFLPWLGGRRVSGSLGAAFLPWLGGRRVSGSLGWRRRVSALAGGGAAFLGALAGGAAFLPWLGGGAAFLGALAGGAAFLPWG